MLDVRYRSKVCRRFVAAANTTMRRFPHVFSCPRAPSTNGMKIQNCTISATVPFANIARIREYVPAFQRSIKTLAIIKCGTLVHDLPADARFAFAGYRNLHRMSGEDAQLRRAASGRHNAPHCAGIEEADSPSCARDVDDQMRARALLDHGGISDRAIGAVDGRCVAKPVIAACRSMIDDPAALRMGIDLLGVLVAAMMTVNAHTRLHRLANQLRTQA